MSRESSTTAEKTIAETSPALDAHVSVFQGSTNTTPVECVPLTTVLERIQDGTYQHDVKRLRHLLTTAGKARYDAAKKHSVAFTPAGVFAQRASAQLTTPSRLLNFDFDHPPNLAEAKACLVDDPWVVYAFISPSGDGLKVAVWASGIVDDATYKHAWGTVLDYFKRTYPDLAVANDDHCKDIARLCYVSFDPDLHHNPDALLFAVPAYQAPAPKLKPAPQPTSAPLPADRRQRYAQQATDTAVKMIDASVPPTATSTGTRHASRLKAATLLGGYIAGGILTYGEAHAALQEAVERNTDDFSRSMKTIEDGLRHGEEHPITFDALEAERLDWLQTHRAPLVTRRNGTHAAAAPVDPPQDTRPVIRLGPDITRLVDEGEAALLALPDGPILFQRARRLSLIARGVKPPRWLHRPAEAPVIVEGHSRYLDELATQAARWEKFDKRAKKGEEWQEVMPPTRFVETLQARPAWRFPLLEGIIQSPTLRPDGSVLDTPGYDVDTGLYFDSNGTVFPSLPPLVTMDQARSALGRLQEVTINFPWATDTRDFSAWLGAVCSVVCRFTILGCVPLFGITATTRGSGKSLLADTIALIGTGHTAARWSQVYDDDEERKRLLSLALDGDPLICIDNITAPLGSGALAAALTGSTIKDRLLGVNQTKEAPMTAVFLCTGNNTQYIGDVARRVVPIALDPQMERPEERTDFAHTPLLPWVQRERPRLTMAALTIIKGYFDAGCPAQALTPFGSFEAWSDLIRHALVWLGEADPCEGRKDIEASSNPDFETLAGVLASWHACYGTTAKTLAQVGDDIEKLAQHIGPETTRNDWNTLQDALGACDRRFDGKRLNTPRVGKTLRQWQGRIIDGKRLVILPVKESGNKTLWQIDLPNGC